MDVQGPSTGTLLQRRKRTIKLSKEETLLILRSYLEHPTKWGEILDDVKENLDQLPQNARELYQTSSAKQLRDRMSTKLGKLVSQEPDNIEDLDIRSAVQDIRQMERRLVRQPSPPRLVRQPSPPRPNNENDVRENIAAALSGDSDEEQNVAPPQPRRNRAKKRPLADIIRENQLAYNRFITRKIPKLMRQLGVSSDSDSE